MRLRNVWLVCAGLLLAFVLLVAASLDKPLGSDEFVFLVGAQHLALTGTPWVLPSGQVIMLHPPLYLYLLAFCYRVFGFHVWSARLVGMVCAALVLGLSIRRLIQKPVAIHHLGLGLACLVLNPAFIQGALLLDIDNTLLVLFTLAFLLTWIEIEMRGGSPKVLWAMSALWAILFWSKLTTPFFLALLLAGWLVLRGRWNLLTSFCIPIALRGTVLFLVSFAVYCSLAGLDAAEPLHYLAASVAEKSPLTHAQGILRVGKDAFEVFLWFQPALLMLFGLMVCARIGQLVRGKSVKPQDLLWVFAAGLMGGYLIVGGTTFGFPRYFLPALPPACLAIAGFVRVDQEAVQWRWKSVVGLASLLACVQLFVLGDPIHTWRYALREAWALGGTPQPLLRKLALQLALGTLVPFGVWWLYLNRGVGLQHLRLALFLTAIVQGAGLSLVQAVSPHNVNYNYGETGALEVAREIKRHIQPGQQVVAPLEIPGWLTWKGTFMSDVPGHVWNQKDHFLRAILKPSTSHVAYSVSTNTVSQFRQIFLDPEVQGVLQRLYHAKRIGGYTLWIRRGR